MLRRVGSDAFEETTSPTRSISPLNHRFIIHHQIRYEFDCSKFQRASIIPLGVVFVVQHLEGSCILLANTHPPSDNYVKSTFLPAHKITAPTKMHQYNRA